MATRRIKTYGDCIRTLNHYFNLLNKNVITIEKAHQLRLYVMSILDVIKSQDLERLKDLIHEEQQNEKDWTE